MVIHATPAEQKENFLNSEKVRDQRRYLKGFGLTNQDISYGKPSISTKIGTYNNETLDTGSNYLLALERAS